MIFKDHADEILLALKNLSWYDILLLLGFGVFYQIMDAFICRSLVNRLLPGFYLRQALDVTLLGVFGNVVTFAAGSIPMQTFYLHRCGLETGHGVGIMMLEYIMHKGSVVLFATILLLIEGGWLFASHADLSVYILVGYLICLGIIVVLISLCTWSKAYHLAIRFTDFVKRYDRWCSKAIRVQQQLNYLYEESRSILKNTGVLLKVFLLNILKLSVFCLVPYVCQHMIGIYGITPIQGLSMTSLMLLITSAIPNVAGMGPTEFAFLMLYVPLFADGPAASLLLLFRLATYYFPFLLSIAAFFKIQRQFQNLTPTPTTDK